VVERRFEHSLDTARISGIPAVMPRGGVGIFVPLLQFQAKLAAAHAKAEVKSDLYCNDLSRLRRR
jgi:hypothetical protein